MSFVSIIASERWASAVSDHLLVDIGKNGDMTVLPGSKPSMFKISARQIVACTGSASVLHRLKTEWPFRESAYSFDRDFMRTGASAVEAISITKQDILLALIDSSGPMICHMFSNQPDQEWQTLVPEGGRLATLFLAGRGIDKERIRMISRRCSSLLQPYEKISPDRAYAVQKQLNQYATALDKTVGARIFRLAIQK